MLANRRAYATIPASDIARAKRWYEEKLGLKPAAEASWGLNYRLADGTGFGLYPTENAGKAPNTLTCPTCLGLPGTLPRANARAIHFGLMIGLALGSELAARSIFPLQHYFSPDLPTGPQISPYAQPPSPGDAGT
mgnify:CR=1 FL=1